MPADDEVILSVQAPLGQDMVDCAAHQQKAPDDTPRSTSLFRPDFAGKLNWLVDIQDAQASVSVHPVTRREVTAAWPGIRSSFPCTIRWLPNLKYFAFRSQVAVGAAIVPICPGGAVMRCALGPPGWPVIAATATIVSRVGSNVSWISGRPRIGATWAQRNPRSEEPRHTRSFRRISQHLSTS